MNSIERVDSQSLKRDLIILVSFLLIHTFVSLWWLERDTMVRDGDETGHIGAVELFRDTVWRRGYFRGVEETYTSPTGDYPPFYMILSGSISLLLPSRLAVEDLSALPSILYFDLTVLLTFFLLKIFLPSPYPIFGALILMLLPLPSSFSRYAMPENLVLLLNTLFLFLLIRGIKGASRPGSLLMGLTFAAGVLTKQTFFLFSLPPLLLWVFRQFRKGGVKTGSIHLFLLLLPPALFALPWYLWRFGAQWEYTLWSAPYRGEASLLEHLLYYPLVLFSHAGGPILLILLIPAPFFLRRGMKRWGVLYFALLVSLLLPLLLITLLPKKYPRLLLPLIPIFAAWGVVPLHFMGKRIRTLLPALLFACGLAGYVTINLFSTSPVRKIFAFYPDMLIDFEPNCFQYWIRGPCRDDLLFGDIEAAYRENFGRIMGRKMEVAFLWEPAIPCEYETTFPYSYHFEQAMRRKGYEVRSLSWESSGGTEEFFEELISMPAPLLIAGGAGDAECEEEGGAVVQGIVPSGKGVHLLESLRSRSRTLWFTLCLYERGS